MGMVVSLVARKGGVGKTTTALNLAGAAIDDGAKSVLVVDMDSQASLSKSLLGASVVEGLRADQTVQAVVDGSRSAGDVARETPICTVHILPSHPDLRVPADALLNLAGTDYDLVLIDLPPDVRDNSVRCALLASTCVVSPVIPEGFGLQSCHSVQQLLMAAGMASNPRLIFAGWLLSMVQKIAIHRVCEDTMRRLHGSTVFDTVLPHAAAFKESAAAGVPITQHQPRTAAARAIRAVWNEMLERVEHSMKRGAA